LVFRSSQPGRQKELKRKKKKMNKTESRIVSFLRSRPKHTCSKTKIAEHLGCDAEQLDQNFRELETNGLVRKLGKYSLVLKGRSTNSKNPVQITSSETLSMLKQLSDMNSDVDEAGIRKIAWLVTDPKNLKNIIQALKQKCVCKFQNGKYIGQDNDPCKPACEEGKNFLSNQQEQYDDFTFTVNLHPDHLYLPGKDGMSTRIATVVEKFSQTNHEIKSNATNPEAMQRNQQPKDVISESSREIILKKSEATVTEIYDQFIWDNDTKPAVYMSLMLFMFHAICSAVIYLNSKESEAALVECSTGPFSSMMNVHPSAVISGILALLQLLRGFLKFNKILSHDLNLRDVNNSGLKQ
jgi:hypothetical protein